MDKESEGIKMTLSKERIELERLRNELAVDFNRSSIIGKSKEEVAQARKRLVEISKRVLILTKAKYS